jgi:hypothetical protein
MTLSKYLTGIPATAQLQALRAAANTIYTQHLNLLTDIHKLSPSKQAEVITDLDLLIEDAKAIQQLGVLEGHEAVKIKMVANLNINRQRIIQQLNTKDDAKVKATESKQNPLTN